MPEFKKQCVFNVFAIIQTLKEGGSPDVTPRW